ncbi:MAG: NADH-quinone oxidoreductase subunit NuoH [Rhodocyclaceae bacterium]|nr:NADH-quinone oxidoreductase subunit NuoH [Rhodocyclaceae bacterium]MBX3667763.1 NADH-quinone oxidoreductase subunit NuoH [Rhodocyclaceae bacterium]
MEFLQQVGQQWFGAAWPAVWTTVWTIIKILVIVLPVFGGVAYLTLAERRVIGAVQVRIGPNRVGPLGILQPLADGLKLFIKEIIIPTGADKKIFLLAPILSLGAALAGWAVVPFSEDMAVANIDAGLLYVMAITSMGVYGIMLGGWASNSKYAFLGAMRSAAQVVSYELAMGFALVCVLLVSGSLNLTDVVHGQAKGWFAEHGLGFLSWNWLPLLPMFAVYLISGVAEANRAPFDLAEGESEIVAGFHVDYSGMAFAVFQLAEYGAIILISALTSTLFLGGWLSPVGFLPNGLPWLLLKMFFVIFLFLWFRATFPRFRYDQVMRLGWKIFIPLTLVWLTLVAAWVMSPWNIWK